MPVLGDGFRNSNSNSGGSTDPVQSFTGVLDSNGEFAITGVGFSLSNPRSFGYLSRPPDGNNGLYVDIVSDTSAILKNTGDGENVGASVFVNW